MSSRRTLHLEVATRTHVGLVRSRNEDTALVTPLTMGCAPGELGDGMVEAGPTGALLAVCDGMGGSAGGEVASRHAAQVLATSLREHSGSGRSLPEILREAMLDASSAVRRLADERRELRGMGTTATACAVREGELVLAHVGDTRAYLLRSGRLTLMTRDQSLAMHLVEAGQLAPEDLATCEFRNIILQAVGSADPLDVDVRAVELRRGDVLLICSDGLWDVVAPTVLESVLRAAPSAARACDELVTRALEAGGPDNVTCVVARVLGDALDRATADETPVVRRILFDPKASARSAIAHEPPVSRGSTCPDERPTRPSTGTGRAGRPTAPERWPARAERATAPEGPFARLRARLTGRWS